MSPAAVDVAVVGGGPAGCAAALTLRRYTRRRIVLIERSAYAELRIGEAVSGGLEPLLDYLGMPEMLADEGHLQAFGTAAAWGGPVPITRDFLFTGRGAGWHLDRLRFDAALAQTAEHMGVAVLRGTSVISAAFERRVWHLELKGAVSGAVTARQVIDATGRSGAVARRVGARRRVFDRLVGLAAHLRLPAGRMLEHTALIEAVPDGWWYSAPVPSGVVATFMTDADTLPSGAGNPDTFIGLLGAAPLTAIRLAGCILASVPRVRPASSHVLEPCLGEAWIAAGDTAAAFDPLSSLGIGYALASGIQTARIVEGRLKGDETLALTYPADVARHVAAHLEQQRNLYRIERRWPDRPFWMRRFKSGAYSSSLGQPDGRG